MENDEELDATFFALANPTRRAILETLAHGEATVKALAEPFDMTLPAISKHIRVLEEAGLITRGRNAQFRPCILNAEPLKSASLWTDRYRHIWDARFEKMDRLIQSLKDSNDE